MPKDTNIVAAEAANLESPGSTDFEDTFKAEQADQLSDADAMLVAALSKYASKHGAYDALVKLEPKMMMSGQARSLLNGQKYRAAKICEDLAPKEGEPDNHRHDRNTKLKTVKDEIKYLFRGMEQVCFAADRDPAEMGIELMLNDPDIQNMGKSETKPPQQQNDNQEQDRLFLITDSLTRISPTSTRT